MYVCVCVCLEERESVCRVHECWLFCFCLSVPLSLCCLVARGGAILFFYVRTLKMYDPFVWELSLPIHQDRVPFHTHLNAVQPFLYLVFQRTPRSRYAAFHMFLPIMRLKSGILSSDLYLKPDNLL